MAICDMLKNGSNNFSCLMENSLCVPVFVDFKENVGYPVVLSYPLGVHCDEGDLLIDSKVTCVITATEQLTKIQGRVDRRFYKW